MADQRQRDLQAALACAVGSAGWSHPSAFADGAEHVRKDERREVLRVAEAHGVTLKRLEAHCDVMAVYPGAYPYVDACLLALRDILRAAVAVENGADDGD